MSAKNSGEYQGIKRRGLLNFIYTQLNYVMELMAVSEETKQRTEDEIRQNAIDVYDRQYEMEVLNELNGVPEEIPRLSVVDENLEIQEEEKEAEEIERLIETLPDPTIQPELAPMPAPAVAPSRRAPRSKSAISIISVHGAIPCVRNRRTKEIEPKMIEIPDGIEIVKLTASDRGIISWYEYSHMCRMIGFVNHYAKYLLNNPNDATIDTCFQFMAREFEKINKNIKNQVRKVLKDKSAPEHYDDDSALLNRFDYMYKIFKLKPGDTIVDKLYTRRIREKRHNDMSITELTEYIQQKPLPDLPDMMTAIHPRRSTRLSDTYQKITLGQLINYYKERGFTKLFIVDLSCSIFTQDDGVYTNASLTKNEDRRLRRYLATFDGMENGLPYGGTNKTTRNKTKRNTRAKTKKNKR